MLALKDISSGISKVFSNKKIILLLVFLVVAWLLISFSGSSKMNVNYDAMTNYTHDSQLSPASFNEAPDTIVGPPMGGVADGAAPVQDLGNYTPIQSANPVDLLPNDMNNAWASLNPTSQGNIANPDLLQAGYHIGIDTIGQTLRIPNLQLRSDPIIAKQMVGPWNQAPDVDPDYGRVPLDPGCGN